MALVSRGQNFGATETITNTKLHNLVDLATVTQIVNSDCDSGMGLVDTKLADITTGSKIRGTAISNLPSIPSSAGLIPFINIPTNILGISLVSIPNTALVPLTLASLVDGTSLRNLASIPTISGLFNYKTLVSSLASGGGVFFDGSNNFIGTTRDKFQIFTASGTFVAPAGVTRVYLSMWGAGASGSSTNSGNGGGGGGSGASCIQVPYIVTPGNSYTVTIGAGGTSRAGGQNGIDGGATSFDVLSVNGGIKGLTDSTGGAGGAIPTPAINATTTTGGGRSGPPFYVGGNGGTTASGTGGGGGGTSLGAGANGASSGSPTSPSANTGTGGGGNAGGFSTGTGSDGLAIVQW